MTSATTQLLSVVLCLMLPVALGIILTLVVVAVRSRRTTQPRLTRLPGKEPQRATELPYQRQPHLLTPAEREFFAVLRAAAPAGWYVFPQVRLANLVELKQGTRNWKPHFSRIAQKCVDFVLCDDIDISPRLVVELDDSSHDRADRRHRDAFVDAALGAANLPILHVRWQRRYDGDQLARQIVDAVGLSSAPLLAGASFQAQLMLPVPAEPPREASAGETLRATVTSVQRWACRSCGKELQGSLKYCPGCGARLEP